MVEAQIEFNALAIFVFLANKLVLHNLFKREDKCDITFYWTGSVAHIFWNQPK